MWGFALPALTAIGINAGFNLLRGKPLLQNAPQAGVTGGILGGPGSGLFNMTKVAEVPATAGAFEASMGLPLSAPYAAGATGMSGLNTVGSMGMKLTPWGTYANDEYYSNILGTPTYTGGQGILSNIGSNISSAIPEGVKEYATPQNLIGVTNALASSNPTPNIPSPGGSIRGGGGAVNYQPLLNVTVHKRRRG